MTPLCQAEEPEGQDDRRASERAPALRLEVVETEAGWQGLEPVWDDLLHRTPDWTPLQLFQLQRLWWRTFAEGSRLFIVVLREGDRVRAIAPFQIITRPYLGRPRRLLTYVGDRREIDRPTVLRVGEDPEALRQVFGYVLDRQAEWDSLLLYDLARESTALSIATELFRAPEVLSAVVDVPVSPFVDTTGDWDVFLKGKSRIFRKTLRRRHRQLSQAGQLSFATYQGWPEVKEAFALYQQVERQSWKAQSRLDLGREASFLDYHAGLVDVLGPEGKLVFRILWLDERPIAASFGLYDGGQFLALHIVHDEAFKRYSPGVVLTSHELEACYRDPDCREYDMLGGHLNNKLSWEPKLRQTCDLLGYRKEPLFHVLYAWEYRLKPELKDRLQRLGLYEPLLRAKARLTGSEPASTADHQENQTE